MGWNTAWSYLPINYNTKLGTIENITQRTILWNNVNGRKGRLKFSNRYGTKPLILEKVVIAQRKSEEGVIENPVIVTYEGNESIYIGARDEFYSDEFEFSILAGTDIVLSVYVKEQTDIESACSTWSARSFRTVYATGGDYTLDTDFTGKESREVFPFVEADVNKATILFGISEIQLESEEKVKTICLFGDSITHMSYLYDALAKKAYELYPGEVTLVNRGIGGNRVLHDATKVPGIPGEGKFFGVEAVDRFEADVFENLPPDAILFLEGVNDLMHPYIFNYPEEIVSAMELQDAVEQFINKAKEKKAQIYIGTIMPFRNDDMVWLEEAEQVRNQFNTWVRTQCNADGILDYDANLRDPARTQYLQDGLHTGDGLHPNVEGGIEMAKLIPLSHIMKQEK